MHLCWLHLYWLWIIVYFNLLYYNRVIDEILRGTLSQQTLSFFFPLQSSNPTPAHLPNNSIEHHLGYPAKKAPSYSKPSSKMDIKREMAYHLPNRAEAARAEDWTNAPKNCKTCRRSLDSNCRRKLPFPPRKQSNRHDQSASLVSIVTG